MRQKTVTVPEIGPTYAYSANKKKALVQFRSKVIRSLEQQGITIQQEGK